MLTCLCPQRDPHGVLRKQQLRRTHLHRLRPRYVLPLPPRACFLSLSSRVLNCALSLSSVFFPHGQSSSEPRTRAVRRPEGVEWPRTRFASHIPPSRISIGHFLLSHRRLFETPTSPYARGARNTYTHSARRIFLELPGSWGAVLVCLCPSWLQYPVRSLFLAPPTTTRYLASPGPRQMYVYVCAMYVYLYVVLSLSLSYPLRSGLRCHCFVRFSLPVTRYISQASPVRGGCPGVATRWHWRYL